MRRPGQATRGKADPRRRFPRQKRVDEFDFEANKAINPAVLPQLAACGWVKAGQPLCLICDPVRGSESCDSGTGKIAPIDRLADRGR